MNARAQVYVFTFHPFLYLEPAQTSTSRIKLCCGYTVKYIQNAFVAKSLKRTVGVLFFVFLCGSAKRVNTLISTLDLPWMNQKEE